jgi:hypothetical protein
MHVDLKNTLGGLKVYNNPRLRVKVRRSCEGVRTARLRGAGQAGVAPTTPTPPLAFPVICVQSLGSHLHLRPASSSSISSCQAFKKFNATRLLSKQTQSSSWMAVLFGNLRRIRRKLLSRRFYPILVFFACSIILLFYHINRIHIPTPVIHVPQFTSNVDDPAINWTKVAYVQYADSLEDLCKAVMLFSELKEVSSLGLRVLLYPNNWSINAGKNGDRYTQRDHIATLLRYAADEFSVILNPTDTLWRGSYTNFLAFGLTQFNRVIILGHDSIVLNSMDELFFLPPAPLAMPYVYWSEPAGWRLSNQIMVIQPSSTEFAKIENAMWNADKGETVVSLVNKLYNETLIQLPARPYHILTEEFRRRDREHEWYLGSSKERWDVKEILQETKLVHFFDTQIPKPWMASNTTWQKFTPRCFAVAYRSFDCSSRNAWYRFYNDYQNRRRNVCGIVL